MGGSAAAGERSIIERLDVNVSVVPAHPYSAAFVADKECRDQLSSRCLWLGVPAPVRNCAQGRDDLPEIGEEAIENQNWAGCAGAAG
jgi:hypothetical protein